jgi:hypothetical protein
MGAQAADFLFRARPLREGCGTARRGRASPIPVLGLSGVQPGVTSRAVLDMAPPSTTMVWPVIQDESPEAK